MELVGQGLKGADINLIYFNVLFLCRGEIRRHWAWAVKSIVISLSMSGFAVLEANGEVCPSREGTQDRRQCPAEHEVTVSSASPLLSPDARQTLCTPTHPPALQRWHWVTFPPKHTVEKIPNPLPAQPLKY